MERTQAITGGARHVCDDWATSLGHSGHVGPGSNHPAIFSVTVQTLCQQRGC